MDTNGINNKPEVQKEIVKHYAGSLSYGTNLPSSDTDYRGIFVAPKEYIITPWYNVREVNDEKEEDTKSYELNNFMELYLDANPNIMETLWVRKSDILFSTEEYDLLRDNAQKLLSTKLAFTYTGYAHNQATRMKNHHGWMDKERTGIRILQEYIESTPCEQMKEWVKDTFPEHVYNLLDFSKCNAKYIKGSLKTEKYMRNASLQMLSTLPLAQYHFIKLVHNYLPHQVLDRDFSIMDYNNGYELIPYGENIFAVVKKDGSKCINSDGSIHKIDTSNRTLEEIKQQPCLIVKFNKDEYLKSSDNRKSYHSWKKNRNEARSELEQKNGYDCYLDSSTEFLTKEGFKKYDEITEHDLIGTVNPVTKSIEFQKYSERIKKPFNGKMYHGETQNTAFTVTGNHRMFVSNVKRSNGTKYIEEKSDWHYISLENMINDYQSYYHILSTIENNNEDYDISDDYLKLLGCYMSEGSFLRYKGNPKGISISQLENGRLCKYIDSINEFEIKKYSYMRDGKNELTYNLYNTKLANEVFELCGEYESSKRMIPFVTELSKRQANLLLDVMISGDGTNRKYSDIYYTSSPLMTSGFQVLALMAGKLTKIWNYLDKHGTNQIYTSNKNSPSVLITNKHIKEVQVDDHIVCFTVPNENLITRNNGKIAIQGNTKHAMHVVRLLRTAQEALETGVINVYRPDAKELLAIRNGSWTYDEMMEYWKEMDDKIRNEIYHKSVLPNKPDIKLAAKVLMDIREIQWYGKK